MENKPQICPYCNESLVIEKDYSFEIVEKNKSHFDLKNTRKRFFYICQKCQSTVGEIKEDKVEWVSQEEANKRLKWIEENRTIQIKNDKQKMKDKLFKNLRNVFDMGAVFSGITVSDEAIKKALDGNGAMCEALIAIIKERIEWWKECDINKALYAQEFYVYFERFIKEIENVENKG